MGMTNKKIRLWYNGAEANIENWNRLFEIKKLALVHVKEREYTLEGEDRRIDRFINEVEKIIASGDYGDNWMILR